MDERAFNQFRADYSVAELQRKFESEEAAQAAQASIFDGGTL